VRILHVVTTLDVGGAEMHLLAQTRGQVARGHSVALAWLKGEGRLAPDFRAAGADPVRPLPRGPGLLLALARRMRAADLVHSHLLKADAACALVAPLCGRAGRLVSGKHNDERALLRKGVARAHAVLARVPRRTIVLSDHVGRFFVAHGGVPPGRVRRVYYGLDPTPFEQAAAAGPAARAATRAALGVAPGEVVFVCVARFAPQKAHDVLLRAFARARAAPGAPPLRLLLVGDDPYGDGRERAEALARELGLGEAAG
jgi:glycosyltransferase involved in cell wall biosynthesis